MIEYKPLLHPFLFQPSPNLTESVPSNNIVLCPPTKLFMDLSRYLTDKFALVLPSGGKITLPSIDPQKLWLYQRGCTLCQTPWGRRNAVRGTLEYPFVVTPCGVSNRLPFPSPFPLLYYPCCAHADGRIL